MKIRSLQGSDVTPVVRIWNAALKRKPIDDMRFVRTILADPDYWAGGDSGLFVALGDAEPVGFCRAVIRRCPNDRLGLETDDGWIPVLAVAPDHQRRGVGAALLRAALDYFDRHGRRRVWVCGTPTSAPGSFVPGVDLDACPAALALFQKFGFVVDQFGYSMAREIIDFEGEGLRRVGSESSEDVQVISLTPPHVQDLLVFVAAALPGAWCVAARSKIQSGALHEMLVAVRGERITGYCQWTGEHFGPFGVAPEVRNQRIGARLFVEAVRRIRASGGRSVWFNWADEAAARFYRRFGLRETRRFAILRKDL